MKSTVRTKLGTFVVDRRVGPENVKMCKGMDDYYEEPAFHASVIDSSGELVGSVSNSTLLCLPGGSVQAPLATDRQIVAAIIGDEHIYDTEANGQVAAEILGT